MTHHHHHHHGHHDHAHSHHHPHGADTVSRLRGVLLLTSTYMLVEFMGGWLTHSLALLADAGHMLTDVGAIALALFAAWFSKHPASSQKTYGYYRLEIFAALMNGVMLLLLSFYIVTEAYHRYFSPQTIHGDWLTWIALGGLFVNLFAAKLLFQHGETNLNIRAALYHVISDCLGSIAAIIAGLCVTFFNYPLADPILSVVIALLVLYNGFKLVWEASHVLLEASPGHLNVAQIKAALLDLPQISAVHDLHVWTITSGKEALSAHVVVKQREDYTPEMVTCIQQALQTQFGLTHLTIQLETPDFEERAIPCP